MASTKEPIGEEIRLEKKRAVKEERLQSHLQNYLNDVSARRSLAAAKSDPSESVDAFLASFSHSRDQVRRCRPSSVSQHFVAVVKVLVNYNLDGR